MQRLDTKDTSSWAGHEIRWGALGSYLDGAPDFGDITLPAIKTRATDNRFGRLIDTARAEPVVVEKHGRPVVVVMAIEEYERLTGEAVSPSQAKSEG